jgi:hypothetical protein
VTKLFPAHVALKPDACQAQQFGRRYLNQSKRNKIP